MEAREGSHGHCPSQALGQRKTQREEEEEEKRESFQARREWGTYASKLPPIVRRDGGWELDKPPSTGDKDPENHTSSPIWPLSPAPHSLLHTLVFFFHPDSLDPFTPFAHCIPSVANIARCLAVVPCLLHEFTDESHFIGTEDF